MLYSAIICSRQAERQTTASYFKNVYPSICADGHRSSINSSLCTPGIWTNIFCKHFAARRTDFNAKDHTIIIVQEFFQAFWGNMTLRGDEKMVHQDEMLRFSTTWGSTKKIKDARSKLTIHGKSPILWNAGIRRSVLKESWLYGCP